MTNSSGSRGFLSVPLGCLIVAVFVAGVVIGLAVSVAAWSFLGGGAWRGEVTVMEAGLLSPDRLALTVGSCNGDPEVSLLRETDVDVQVKVVAFSTPLLGGNQCADGVVVYLREPLGGRVVVDKHTGQSVTVSTVRSEVTVVKAELRSPDRLALIVGSCNGDPVAALLRETDVGVQVSVVASSTPLRGGGDCQDIVEVQLQKPLGGRVVVDNHTGQSVTVSTVE